jgi:hypothetical protein
MQHKRTAVSIRALLTITAGIGVNENQHQSPRYRHLRHAKLEQGSNY